jgi:hypothetical protein
MPRGRLICGEYRALEQALWSEIDRLQSGDPLRRVTVVAPSHWLVRHLKLSAVRWRPHGVFGIRILNLFQLVVGLAGEGADRLVSPIVTERLLLEWLESLDRDSDSAPEPALRTYDFAAALAAAVRDLRDAALEDDPSLIVERLRDATIEAGTRLHALDIRKFSTLLQAYRYYTTALRTAALLDDADLSRPRCSFLAVRTGTPGASATGFATPLRPASRPRRCSFPPLRNHPYPRFIVPAASATKSGSPRSVSVRCWMRENLRTISPS